MTTYQTLRPGIMVSLSTSCTGNVKYFREDITDTRERSEWNTTRTIADPDEYDRAKKVQSKARNTVERLCVKSKFAKLCPQRDADLLEAAISEARAMCDE